MYCVVYSSITLLYPNDTHLDTNVFTWNAITNQLTVQTSNVNYLGSTVTINVVNLFTTTFPATNYTFNIYFAVDCKYADLFNSALPFYVEYELGSGPLWIEVLNTFSTTWSSFCNHWYFTCVDSTTS